MNRLIDLARGAAKAALRQHYRRNHLRAARITLQGLVDRYGPLPDEDRRKCDDYAVRVLGHRRYAPWLYVYSHVAGGFKEGWVSDNFYDECVLPHTSGTYRELSGFRVLNSLLFEAEEFPDVAALVNGLIVDRLGRPIAEDRLTDTLFAENDRLVFKQDDSQSGTGITMLDRASFDPRKAAAMGSGVLQGFIRQHPIFPRLSNSASVATIRLTTASDDRGEVSLRASYLRLGRAQESHVLSSTEVRISIDAATGALSATGYMPDWERIDRHPDADVPFAGEIIPNFLECVRVVIRCHERLRFVRCIGWDLCVDVDEKVKIIEWNGGHNGIKFSEAIDGPCFADLNWQKFRR